MKNKFGCDGNEHSRLPKGDVGSHRHMQSGWGVTVSGRTAAPHPALRADLSRGEVFRIRAVDSAKNHHALARRPAL